MTVNAFITVGLGLFIVGLPLIVSASMILLLAVAHAPALVLTPLLLALASALAAGLWLLHRSHPLNASPSRSF